VNALISESLPGPCPENTEFRSLADSPAARGDVRGDVDGDGGALAGHAGGVHGRHLGLFQKAAWWEGLALVSAALGVVVLIPYWLAASDAGEPNPGFNVLIHALGDAGVFVLLLVPNLEHWVSDHVLAGH